MTTSKRYLATAFLFLIAGGLEALIMRLQLARPNAGVLDPEAYDQIFTMHAVTMIFWYASPILSGFANYLIPLMIGARDSRSLRAQQASRALSVIVIVSSVGLAAAELSHCDLGRLSIAVGGLLFFSVAGFRLWARGGPQGDTNPIKSWNPLLYDYGEPVA